MYIRGLIPWNFTELVRQVLEYVSSVWDPQGVCLQCDLEIVQKSPVRFVTGSYFETWSMTGIFGQLKMGIPQKRRKDNRLILLYIVLKGKASLPTGNLIPLIRRERNHNSLAFQAPTAGTDIYKGSFFPQTNRGWNAITESVISSAEVADDCATKLTSLMRAVDYLIPQLQVLVNYCHFRRFISKLS